MFARGSLNLMRVALEGVFVSDGMVAQSTRSSPPNVNQ